MRHDRITINGRAVLSTYILDDTPELKVSKRPAVLIFPGGGYVYCSDREAEQVAISYNGAGFNAFVLRYTTGTGFKKAYEDAVGAMRYLTEHKEDYDMGGLAVCGFSAGAHLAASMGTMCDIKPDGMILVYPPMIGEEWASLWDDVEDILSKIDSETAKAFIVHAFDDPVVPIHNAYWLMQKLDENNVEFEAHVFRSGGHGFSVATRAVGGGDESYDNDVKSIWVPLSIKWIKDVIGDIEFIKNPKESGFPIPEILKKTIKELIVTNREFIQDFNPMFKDERLIQGIGSTPMIDILIAANMTEEEITDFANNLK